MKNTIANLFCILIAISGMLFVSCEEENVELTQVPQGISNLKAEALSSTEIILTWKDNSDNEDGFRIDRAIRSDTLVYVPIATVTNDTSYKDIDLVPLTTYLYRVY
ncbi:MAG: fibronectin type III domain-containing protein, partial [Ignavibacteriae bacterium]|nr:fibronectin type III domain-containing protein [Ignavibacteriota bacterium]